MNLILYSCSTKYVRLDQVLKEAIEAAGRKPYANEAEAEGTVLLKVLVLTKYIPYDIFGMDYRIQI